MTATRRLAYAAAATAAVLLSYALAMVVAPWHSPAHRTAAVSTAPAPPQAAPVPACTKPAPATAAGYAAMFAHVPTVQWGGADVALSVPLPSGRVVWLYGDTFSQVTRWAPFAGRMFHSSAIVQTGGCLHVSQQGSWVLPGQVDLTNYDNPATAKPVLAWYWIKGAVSYGRTSPYGFDYLLITADHVQATGDKPWQFKVIGQRTAQAWVSASGDVGFVQWVNHAPAPVQHVVRKDGPYPPWSPTVSDVRTGKVLVTGLPHSRTHFSYAPSVHPEAHLASGRTLLTVCQNATPLRSYAAYRPLFFEVAR